MPWVNGVDDFPELTGTVEVCDKADRTRTYSVYSVADSQELRQAAHATVNYIPVQATARSRRHAIRVKVTRDGVGWAGVHVTALRGSSVVGRLTADTAGVARLDTRELKPGAKPVRFRVGTASSPIAFSNKVPLPE